jgi:beta-galactosidase
MESTPSVTNWQGISRPKRPGLHQLASLQAVAHGANSVQYFQWRQSRGGSEKFHGAVVSHAGHENTRTFQEVTAVGDLLSQLDSVVGSMNHAEVAVIYDFQNEWALQLAELPRSEDKNYQERCMAHYRPFWQQGITVDIINSTFADLSAYKLVIAPMLYLLQAGVAEKLSAFVQAGGTLVTTYLTGLVDQSDLVFLGGAPGPLKALLGIWVEETDVLFDHHQQTIRPVKGMISGTSYPVTQYADIVHLDGAETAAVYEQDFYAGSPAITVNQVGAGQAYYLAARHDAEFLADFYRGLSDELGVETAVIQPLPLGVTAQVRATEDENFIFLLNFNASEKVIHLDKTTYRDALSGINVCNEITIPAYSLRILRQPISPDKVFDNS